MDYRIRLAMITLLRCNDRCRIDEMGRSKVRVAISRMPLAAEAIIVVCVMDDHADICRSTSVRLATISLRLSALRQ
jgi:hypothetical protein